MEIKTTTTQLTSKTLKLQQAVSVTLIVVGLLMMIGGHGPQAWGAVLGVGAAWYLVTRVRIWWHHD